MRKDMRQWTVEDVNGDVLVFTKAVDSDTGRLITFVVEGCGLDHDDEAVAGYYDAFTIDGRLPTGEEDEVYGDDLRDLIVEVLSQ